MGSQEEIKIENDFILLRFQNDSNETIKIERPVSQGLDRKSTRLNSSHLKLSRMPSSA